MRKYALPFAAAVGLLLAACLSAPYEPTATSSAALVCNASERAFNGSCRKTCATSSDCAAPSSCMTVAAGLTLCIDYSSCAYLSSDTECTGVPYGAYGGGYESFDPYWIPSYEPYTTYSGYSSYVSAGPFGCGGNAVWHVELPSPADDPRCGKSHPVARCQKVGNTCALVSGATMDVADR